MKELKRYDVHAYSHPAGCCCTESEIAADGLWVRANDAIATISAQAATIALLRAEVRAWRDWDENCGVIPLEKCECEDVPRGRNLIAARAATDAAHALEDK